MLRRFFVPSGIKDDLTGQYIISLPSWSKTVYYKGTRIEYEHEDNKYDDLLVVDGPTNIPLRVVVSKCKATCLVPSPLYFVAVEPFRVTWSERPFVLDTSPKRIIRHNNLTVKDLGNSHTGTRQKNNYKQILLREGRDKGFHPSYM